MDIEIVTLELVTETAGEPGRTPRFDPEPLRSVLRRRRVVRVDHHVHELHGQPLVTFVLETDDDLGGEMEEAPPSGSPGTSPMGEAPPSSSPGTPSMGGDDSTAPSPTAPRRASDWARDLPPEHRELFEALRVWRNDTAREDGQSAFLVLTNRTLAALALARPRSMEALLGVHGIGPSKAERYGEAILALMGACDEVTG